MDDLIKLLILLKLLNHIFSSNINLFVCEFYNYCCSTSFNYCEFSNCKPSCFADILRLISKISYYQNQEVFTKLAAIITKLSVPMIQDTRQLKMVLSSILTSDKIFSSWHFETIFKAYVEKQTKFDSGHRTAFYIDELNALLKVNWNADENPEHFVSELRFLNTVFICDKNLDAQLINENFNQMVNTLLKLDSISLAKGPDASYIHGLLLGTIFVLADNELSEKAFYALDLSQQFAVESAKMKSLVCGGPKNLFTPIMH